MVFWNKKGSEGEDERAVGATAGVIQNPPPATVVSPTPAILGAHESTPASSQVSPFLDSSKVRCALGAGTSINGKLSFDTSVQIDGKMKGELFTSKTLIVGSSGVVEAQVDAACLVVAGRVKGVIRVTERLEIKAGGVIEGEVFSPCFVMEEGGRFEGLVSMGARVSGTEKLPHAHKTAGKSVKSEEKTNSNRTDAELSARVETGVGLQ